MKLTVEYKEEGDQICAHLNTFIDLQSSPAGFGATREEARTALVLNLCDDFNAAMKVVNAEGSGI